MWCANGASVIVYILNSNAYGEKAAMKMVQKPLILTNCKFNSQPIKGRYGADGILYNVNEETIIKYDLSQNYEIENGILNLKVEEEYKPKKYSNHQIGIDNVAESYISTKIFESEITSDIVIDGWLKYDGIVPLSKIVKYLIAVDVYRKVLSKPSYLSSTPSWDVCVSLAMYLKLCEHIDGFEGKIHAITDTVEHIKKNFIILDKEIRRGNYFSNNLVQVLESLHSLNDELELAYNIDKHGYKIRFGGRGEPDYFINNVAIEQKSRFPELEHIFQEKMPSNFQYNKAYMDLIFEVKRSKSGLKKSDVYFYNLSRLLKGSLFYVGTEFQKMGPESNKFNLSDMFSNFNTMMKVLPIFLEKGKIIIPYVKPLSNEPKIICTLPISESMFDIIEKEKSRQYIAK